MPRKIGAFHICYQTWLELKNLFQTFEQQDDEVEIEQEIKEIRGLLDEDVILE